MIATDSEFLKYQVNQILILSYYNAPELRIDDWRALQKTVLESVMSKNDQEYMTESELNVLSILSDQTVDDMQKILTLS